MHYIGLDHGGSVTFQLRGHRRSYRGVTGWIEGFKPEQGPHEQVPGLLNPGHSQSGVLSPQTFNAAGE